MLSTHLIVPPGPWSRIREHALGNAEGHEEAGFLYVRAEDRGAGTTLTYMDHRFVRSEGFAFQSSYHIELADTERGAVIKRAHDLSAAVVEFHSHPLQSLARFSPSDVAGLQEFVPHVRWRLPGRPYVALVMAPQSFDAVVWTGTATTPGALAAVHVGKRLLRPTGASLGTWRERATG